MARLMVHTEYITADSGEVAFRDEVVHTQEPAHLGEEVAYQGEEVVQAGLQAYLVLEEHQEEVDPSSSEVEAS